MTKAKRLLSYLGIFMLTMCMAAGFVILQFVFSNKNSQPELVVGAEDTTFSQVINKVMDSDNITAEFDVALSFGEEELSLNGNLKFDLAKVLNAGDDILSNLELSVDCDVESKGNIVPLTLKVIGGMCYVNISNNQLKFEVNDTLQNIGTIATLIGVEIPVSDLMANIDMSNLMGLMENITSEKVDGGYKISIPLFEYGTAEIIADAEYNITQVRLQELNIEGITASVNLDVKTNDENFEIPVLDEEENGIDISAIMKFVKAGYEFVANKKIAGNVLLKAPNIETEFDFGADLNSGIYAYLTSEVLGKTIKLTTQNENLYFNYNDFKFKASYEDISNVVDFVEDYIESLTETSIEDEITGEIENLQATKLTISDILEQLNIVSVDIKELLDAITIEENKLTFTYEGFVAVVILNNDKLQTVELNYDDYALVIEFSEEVKDMGIVDGEYVDYTFYQSIYNRISKFIESKKVALKTEIVLGENKYAVDIKVDLNNGYNIKVATKIGEYDIQVATINKVLYLQINEQKISYSLKSGENLVEILSEVLKSLDFEGMKNTAEAEVEKLTLELYEMLEQITNISKEQVLEILSCFALNYISNNEIDITFGDYEISFGVAQDNLFNVLVNFKDISVLVDISDNEWKFDINENEFVKIDNVNALVNTIVNLANLKQFTLTGNVGYKDINLPITIKADLNKNYVELLTTILDKDVLLVYEDGEVYVKFANVKLKTNVEELQELINLLQLDIKGINVENLANDILSFSQEINIVEVLKTLKLSSNKKSITISYEELFLMLFVKENKLSNIFVIYDEFSGSFLFETAIQKTKLDKENYVPYTHFTNIYNRFENLLNNKKFEVYTTFALNGETYNVAIKADLNGEKLELTTKIFGFDINVIFADNTILLKLNQQKLSYKLSSVEDLAKVITSLIGEENLENEISNKLYEIEEMFKNLKTELSFENKEDALKLLEYFEVSNIYNNGIAINFKDINVSISVCEEKLLKAVVNANGSTFEIILSDDEFEIVVNKEEYVAIDNLNAVVNTVLDIVSSKQISLSGSVAYKTLTLPVIVKVDFENTYFEISTTILEKEVVLVLTQENIYLTIDNLKVKATLAEINDLFDLVDETLKENGMEIDMSSILNNLDVSKDISVEKILEKVIFTNKTNNNLTVVFDDIEVGINQEGNKLSTIKVVAPNVEANLSLSTTITQRSFDDNDFATYEEVKEIYDKIKEVVEQKAFNIVADVTYGDYDFVGNISVDLSDLNNPQLRIYNAYFNEYKIDITYINNTLYAKVNELKVYLAVDLNNIQDVLDKVGYAYNNFTNSNLDIPNIQAMIDDFKQMFEDMLNSAEEFTFEDFMDIYEKITINSASNFKVDLVYDNIKATAQLNGENLINAYVEFDNIKASVGIDKKKTAIYVPDLTDYSNLTPVVDILGKVTDTFSTKKFGLSTTIKVMGETISITGYADLSDFENGPRVSATATIANVPVYITYYNETFYFEAKGLKMSATLKELQQLFEVDIKKFIESTLDETMKGIEEDIREMLSTLDILNSIEKVDNALTLYTSMGLDLTFVENASGIESIGISYKEIGLDATLSVLGFTGDIKDVEGEFTVYKNGIKLAETLIDFVTNETFNVAINGAVANQNLDFVFDIAQKDAYITAINAKGTLGAETRLQVGYLGEEKYILVDGNKVYNYTEEQAQNNTVYTNPAYIFADYNGLKVKMDTTLLDKVVGFITGLFDIDLSVVYDLLNLNIPSYDMEVMQGLVTGYDTEVTIPVDQNSSLEEILKLLDSINLSMDGTSLTVKLTDGGSAVVKTEVVDGVTRLSTLQLIDVAMGEDKINLTIDFYCELPSDMADIPSRDDLSYMDLSTLGNFMEVVVNTANLKRFKLQGEAVINLGSYKFESIDVFADIDLVKTERSDGSYVWKPYIVVWLKSLPDSNTSLSGILLEDAVTKNNGNNHQAVLYIVDNDIYIYRKIDKSKSVMTGFFKWETQYYSEVLEQKKMSFDDLSTTSGVVELLDSIVGLSGLLDGIVESAFENVSEPSDYSPEKIFYNTYNSSSNTYTRSYTYDGKYHILLNGTYLMKNTSIKNLSADISTVTRSDGKTYLSALDFTLDAGVLVNLQGMQLVDSLSHSSYAGINGALNGEILQLEKGKTSFETYFYGLTA